MLLFLTFKKVMPLHLEDLELRTIHHLIEGKGAISWLRYVAIIQRKLYVCVDELSWHMCSEKAFYLSLVLESYSLLGIL